MPQQRGSRGCLYTHRDTHIHEYVCTCVRMYVCVYACICVCMYVSDTAGAAATRGSCACLHVRTHTYTCMCVCAYVRTYVCVHVFVCMYVRKYACNDVSRYELKLAPLRVPGDQPSHHHLPRPAHARRTRGQTHTRIVNLCALHQCACARVFFCVRYTRRTHFLQCVCVCVHTCMCVYECVFMCAYVHVCACICLCARASVCVCIRATAGQSITGCMQQTHYTHRIHLLIYTHIVVHTYIQCQHHTFDFCINANI